MKLLYNNYFDPVIVDDITPYIVEVGGHEQYGEILKNSVENYQKGDKVIFTMKDMASVEQAVINGAKKL